ncbi:MAG: bifunctional adenosylcobinamide kinase/adenosylcobinamide-phosphate guanylyltransferase [Bryobacterales bacterium]|nr:bifunctional adenosylcobinamide kinase/adenosylcobinamide-phosphate guanylyltransferase [Bryobacterales bacterium]
MPSSLVSRIRTVSRIARRAASPPRNAPSASPKGEILEAVPLIFICGGARSGKSGKALAMALEKAERPAFIATAEALDDEMRERIARHREERDSRFEAVEAPVEVAGALRRLAAKHEAIVVDCLTLWLSNVMLRESLNLDVEREALMDALTAPPATVIVVSNEVGCGIVPENALARRFRDEAGRLNARIAAISDEAYWMVFGCALRVK